jgi:hypothetical protein
METENGITEFEFVEVELPRETDDDDDMRALMAPHPCN